MSNDLATRLRDQAMFNLSISHDFTRDLVEAAALIEAQSKPPLSREEMREMLMEKFGTKFVGPNEFFELALAFGEAIQAHWMGK